MNGKLSCLYILMKEISMQKEVNLTKNSNAEKIQSNTVLLKILRRQNLESRLSAAHYQSKLSTTAIG